MAQIFANFLSLVLILLILIRASDDIQFRRQLSKLNNIIGNKPPDEFKNQFDLTIFTLILIWLIIQISFNFIL